MSKYFSAKYTDLTPYTPGEQPQDRKYNKLNTNESPFPPSPYAQKMAREAAGDVQLYSDPDVKALVKIAAQKFQVGEDEIIFTNGSDDILNFAFMAFSDEQHPAAFADITYGFYPVFAALNHVPYREIPLNEDYTLPVEEFVKAKETLFIANPNAPTGIAISLAEVEKIVSADLGRIVVVDEAYVDFGGESAVQLIHKYPNLLVTQTFSKSRSLAGARLGMGFGCKELISDLQTVRYSTNPYNINRMTMAAGIGALIDDDYFKGNCAKIMATRARSTKELEAIGFTVLPSSSNFIFAKHETLGGEFLYKELKERGILVRHFSKPRLTDYNRITIGSDAQMDALIETLKAIIAENC